MEVEYNQLEEFLKNRDVPLRESVTVAEEKVLKQFQAELQQAKETMTNTMT